VCCRRRCHGVGIHDFHRGYLEAVLASSLVVVAWLACNLDDDSRMKGTIDATF
jgi:hypothetical protein